MSKHDEAFVQMRFKYFNDTWHVRWLTLLKLCVSSFLCGFRADLWPFNCNGFYFGTGLLSLETITRKRESKPVAIKRIKQP